MHIWTTTARVNRDILDSSPYHITELPRRGHLVLLKAPENMAHLIYARNRTRFRLAKGEQWPAPGIALDRNDLECLHFTEPPHDGKLVSGTHSDPVDDRYGVEHDGLEYIPISIESNHGMASVIVWGMDFQGGWHIIDEHTPPNTTNTRQVLIYAPTEGFPRVYAQPLWTAPPSAPNTRVRYGGLSKSWLTAADQTEAEPVLTFGFFEA